MIKDKYINLEPKIEQGLMTLRLELGPEVGRPRVIIMIFLIKLIGPKPKDPARSHDLAIA